MNTQSARKAVKRQNRGTGGTGVPESPVSATPEPPPVVGAQPVVGAVNGTNAAVEPNVADAQWAGPATEPEETPASNGTPVAPLNGAASTAGATAATGSADSGTDAAGALHDNADAQPTSADALATRDVSADSDESADSGGEGALNSQPAAQRNGVDAVTAPASAAGGAEPSGKAGSELTGADGKAGRAASQATSAANDDVSGADQPPASSAPAPDKKASRAGRNLPAAIGVSVLLGAVILVALLTVRQVFIGVVAAAVAVSTVELAGAFRRSTKNIEVALLPVLVGGQAMVWLSWAWRTQGILAGFVLTMLACMAWRFRRGSDGYLRDVTASIFVAAYVPLFASFAAMLVEPHDGTARVLCFMIVVVCSDTGGYIAGVLFGKHPMAPSISPKKSWEGFVGSMLAGSLAGSLAIGLLLHAHWWLGLPFGAAIVLTATGGDLTESLIKRDLGIKDMGNLLPGHGGLMDRMDSLLPSAVVSWVLLSLVLPV